MDQVLNWAIKELKKAKIDSAALDAEVLLSFVLKKDKTFLFSNSEKKLTNRQLEKFKKLILRRRKFEPIAYIINNKEFYGLDFYVDKNVLIPRPETELMVEESIKIIGNSKRRIILIDVGTGSGCVLISILRQIPDFAGMAWGIDFSRGALKIARKNAQKYGVLGRTQFVYSNLLENIKFKKNKKYIITANLPYLTNNQYEKLPSEIKKYEPKSALIGGKDGSDYYQKLFLSLASAELTRGSIILLEIDPSQKKSIKKFIKKYFPKTRIEIKKDLARRDRLVIIKL